MPRLFANIVIRRHPDSITYKNMKNLSGGLLEMEELTNLSVWVFSIYKIKWQFPVKEVRQLPSVKINISDSYEPLVDWETLAVMSKV